MISCDIYELGGLSTARKSPKVRCKAGAGGKPGFYKGKQHVYRAGQFQSAGGNREETAGCGRLSPEGHLQAVAEKGKIP